MVLVSKVSSFQTWGFKLNLQNPPNRQVLWEIPAIPVWVEEDHGKCGRDVQPALAEQCSQIVELQVSGETLSQKNTVESNRGELLVSTPNFNTCVHTDPDTQKHSHTYLHTYMHVCTCTHTCSIHYNKSSTKNKRWLKFIIIAKQLWWFGNFWNKKWMNI